jgi:hypothetical protein
MLLLLEMPECRWVLGGGPSTMVGHSRRCQVGMLATGRFRSGGMACIYILTVCCFFFRC